MYCSDSLIITPVPVALIPGMWPKVLPLLNRALAHDDLGEPEYVYRDLISMNYTLWVTIDTKSPDEIHHLFITRVIHGSREKLCDVYAFVGDGGIDIYDKFYDIITAYAKENHCTLGRFVGRMGWQRVLEAKGWKSHQIIMTLDLKDK